MNPPDNQPAPGEGEKYFQDDKHCPECLTLGHWYFEYGCYVCKSCANKFRPDTLGHWNEAFKAGREFEAESLKHQLDAARAERDEKQAVILGVMEERDALKHQLDAAVQQRDNLLCRIHRDGGHYLQAHGVDKACEDADEIVARLNADCECERERDSYKQDIIGAAGELLIPVPEIGTNLSKMLYANCLMRRERDRLRAENAGLRVRVQELEGRIGNALL